MNLSIFSFEKRDQRAAAPRSSWQDVDSTVAVLDAPEETAEHSMLLDLEHLTPEVLDAFFPSESTLPPPAPRNPAKRRGSYSR